MGAYARGYVMKIRLIAMTYSMAASLLFIGVLFGQESTQAGVSTKEEKQLFLITEQSIGCAHIGIPLRENVRRCSAIADYKVTESENNQWDVSLKSTGEVLLTFHNKEVGSPRQADSKTKAIITYNPKFYTTSGLRPGLELEKAKPLLKGYEVEEDVESGATCYDKRVASLKEEVYFGFCLAGVSKIRDISIGYFY
jgi:hypothetical protein